MSAEATPLDAYQAVLDGFVHQGAAIAKAVAAAIERATPAEIPALAATYERITRVVRRTILLIDHRARAVTAAIQTRVAARKRIFRDVTDAIAAERLTPERADALRVELVERLEAFDLAPDLDHEIANRPVEDIIRDIRRDMGLANRIGAPKWPRRTPDDVADILTLAHRQPQTEAQTDPRPHPS